MCLCVFVYVCHVQTLNNAQGHLRQSVYRSHCGATAASVLCCTPLLYVCVPNTIPATAASGVHFKLLQPVPDHGVFFLQVEYASHYCNTCSVSTASARRALPSPVFLYTLLAMLDRRCSRKFRRCTKCSQRTPSSALNSLWKIPYVFPIRCVMASVYFPTRVHLQHP